MKRISERLAPYQFLAPFLFALACLSAAGAEPDYFCDLKRVPDRVSAVTETETVNLVLASPKGSTKSVWQAGGVSVITDVRAGGVDVLASASGIALKRLQLYWQVNLPADWKYLGDAWERAYGDLEWKPLDQQRIMPWYFLATNGKLTHGYGVKTGPAALCHWTADSEGITLTADVRCGGRGANLGQRRLEACTVVCRRGQADETPFAAAQAFCRLMCPKPRLPRNPVYGFNDWYCSYGHDTADEFLKNTAYVVSLAPKDRNRPFAVVDDGWQVAQDKSGTNGPGPWSRTNPKFSSTLTMPEFVKRVRGLGAHPGVWIRPLQASPDQPQTWRLSRDPRCLDPSVPAVRAYVRQVVRRMRGWGFELIKHDYTTEEICGRWGFQMKNQMIADGWAFADQSRTTAEIIRDLYLDIRQAAGNRTVILGCNTIGHLAAGIFELQRVGDDTSGQEWARTRKMGVNCLAFRAPQHGTFFAIDGDCAGQTSADSVPWDKSRQWLDLLARSGTPLFVSFPRDTVRPEQEQALRSALSAAAHRQPLGEPLDWLETRTPTQWRLDGQRVVFSW